MRLAKTLVCVATLFALATAGCSPSDRGNGGNAMAGGAADPQTVQRIRDKYYRAYPGSRVGVVIEVLRDQPFAAVGDLPSPSGLGENQIVTFLDANERVLTFGTIVRVLPDSVHVRYDDPPRGGRAPRRGDLMVRVPFGARTL